MSVDPRLEQIAAAYEATRQRTLAVWEKSPDAGAEAPPPYHPTQRAYAIGSLFTPPAALEPVISRVLDAEGVTAVPREALHYTFLALTPHQWDDFDAMPDPNFLAAGTRLRLHDLRFEISNLKLLPLPNTLLLAGFPSIEMLDARERLLGDLMKNGITAAWLHERYGAAFPPLFWHTTLARSTTTLLPPALQFLYHELAAVNFGRLSMAAPRLHAVNFDWTLRRDVAEML